MNIQSIIIAAVILLGVAAAVIYIVKNRKKCGCNCCGCCDICNKKY